MRSKNSLYVSKYRPVSMLLCVCVHRKKTFCIGKCSILWHGDRTTRLSSVLSDLASFPFYSTHHFLLHKLTCCHTINNKNNDLLLRERLFLFLSSLTNFFLLSFVYGNRFETNILCSLILIAFLSLPFGMLGSKSFCRRRN